MPNRQFANLLPRLAIFTFVMLTLSVAAPAQAIPFCVFGSGYNSPIGNNTCDGTSGPFGDFDPRTGFLQYAFTGLAFQSSGTGISPNTGLPGGPPDIILTGPPAVPDPFNVVPGAAWMAGMGILELVDVYLPPVSRIFEMDLNVEGLVFFPGATPETVSPIRNDFLIYHGESAGLVIDQSITVLSTDPAGLFVPNGELVPFQLQVQVLAPFPGIDTDNLTVPMRLRISQDPSGGPAVVYYPDSAELQLLVAEPSSLVILGAGLAGLAALFYRRRTRSGANILSL